MTDVTSYKILFYGSPEGYQTNRAQITLYNGNKVVAYVRFNDPGMTFEADIELNGIIRMHLPSAMYQNVIDMLRNEKPIQVYFANNRGFLGTSNLESVGEAEE
jgi:hypothetical protein